MPSDFEEWAEPQLLKLFECYCKACDFYFDKDKTYEMVYKCRFTMGAISRALNKWASENTIRCPKELRHRFLISVLEIAKKYKTGISSLGDCIRIEIPKNDKECDYLLEPYKNSLGFSAGEDTCTPPQQDIWKEIPNAWKIARCLNGNNEVTIDQLIDVLNNQAKMLGYKTKELNQGEQQL